MKGSAKLQPMSHSTGMSIPDSSGMTTGVCWMSLLSGTITAHSHLNNSKNNLEVNLSEQSVKD